MVLQTTSPRATRGGKSCTDMQPLHDGHGGIHMFGSIGTQSRLLRQLPIPIQKRLARLVHRIIGARGDIMRIRFILSLLLAGGALFLSTVSFAQVAPPTDMPTMAPPPLPAYEQPMCPGDGYIWTPGYWAWDGAYYWVPGTWVLAPQIGYLWTPGYWGWGGAGFMFNEGYWGMSVGFYGGIDYGFGYFG